MAAAGPALAAMLGMPMLGVLPDRAAEAIQLGLVGSSEAKPEAASLAPQEAAQPPCLLHPPSSTELQPQLLQLAEVELLNRCGFLVLDHFLAERCYAKSCGSSCAAESPLLAR